MKFMLQHNRIFCQLRLSQVVLHSCTLQSSELCNNKTKVNPTSSQKDIMDFPRSTGQWKYESIAGH